MRRTARTLADDPASALQAGRALQVDGFIALDFETATRSRDSACALAVAIVQAGRVAAVHRWLIRPPGNRYETFNTSIHGITPRMTTRSPTMRELWPEVLALIAGRPMVAHNAPFDMSVLRSTLNGTTDPWPDLSYYCTVALSRRAWPHMPAHKLPDMAAVCGVHLDHHDPASDARAAAEIAIACCGSRRKQHLPDAAQALNVAPRAL